MTKQTLERAANLRKEGRLVRTQIGLRGHTDYVEDEDFVWQWLKDSWVDPTVTERGLKPHKIDVVLTDDILQRVKTFWTALHAEPTTIRHIARMKHQIQVPLAIGSENTTVVMMDVPAMVAAHPVLAKPLKDAGVTAEQMMEYRIALVQAAIAHGAGMTVTSDTSSVAVKSMFNAIDPSSTLGKNLQFYKANPQQLDALEKLGLFTLQ